MKSAILFTTLAVCVTSLSAATFNVTTTLDELDATPGNAICATAAGACSLRAAIQEANATDAEDTINVPAGTYKITRIETGENLAIFGDYDIIKGAVTIIGAGAASTIIDADYNDRVFDVFTQLTLQKLDIRNGSGGMVGGAINVNLSGTLEVDDSHIYGSLAQCSGGINVQGGGYAKLVRVFVDQNFTIGGACSGGGLGGTGTADVYDSTFYGNTAPLGGGISVGTFGAFTIYDSTFKNNSANYGGAIINIGGLLLTNVTMTGNSGGPSGSGAIYAFGGQADLYNVTIAGNTTTAASSAGGIDATSAAKLNIVNSIVANNSGGDCIGTIVSGGYNIVSDATTCAFTATGDLTSTDPRLRPLNTYGDLSDGNVSTMPIQPSSPAIDHSTVPCFDPIVGPLMFDQRSFPRPRGAKCDAGAYEWTTPAHTDFQGDGKTDLFWRNTSSGNNSIWLMNGTSVAVTAALPPVPDVSFVIAATGDFQGDGKIDILWRNVVTGTNVVWLMDGMTVAVGALLPTVADLNWTIAGTGDFQRDGKSDVLWRNVATGDNVIWFMNGTTVAYAALLPPVPDTNWTVAAIGDFQGDGKDDIVWRNTATGNNSMWLVDGAAVAAGGSLPAVAVSWTIAGVGDLQGDGKADLIWRDPATGSDSVWLMDGMTVAVSASLPTVAGPWSIVRVGDFQRDGKDDLLWRNSSTGANVQWLMDGPSVAVTTLLPTVGDTSWHVVSR